MKTINTADLFNRGGGDMLKVKGKKGQSTVEYALVIGIIVAALVAMQTYVKRGLNARYHDGIQFLATQTNEIGTATQYEPYYLDTKYENTQNREVKENIEGRGKTTREIQGAETRKRAEGGFEKFLATSDEKGTVIAD